MRDGCTRHHCGGLRYGSTRFEHFGDVRVIDFAKEIPHGRFRWHDVRLIAAIGNHVVRTLLRPKVLATKVPGSIHHLDCVESASAAPWCSSGMRRFAVECKLDRNEAAAADGAIGYCEIASDMGEETDIHIFEVAVTNVVGLGAVYLLRNS